MSDGSSGKILVVEDDAAIRRALRTSLVARGFEVVEVETGHAAVVSAADGIVDLILLDLGLPDIDGIDALIRIREFSALPIVVVTARDRQGEKVRALDAGADDYITKPFDIEELMARVRAALRRRPSNSPRAVLPFVHGELTIDVVLRRITRAGVDVHFTKTEWLLLEQFVMNPAKLLTHSELLRRVWGNDYGHESEYLRVYVGQLRKKLGDNAGSPELILTEPGIGYRWIGEE